jgi:hypothetical protein
MRKSKFVLAIGLLLSLLASILLAGFASAEGSGTARGDAAAAKAANGAAMSATADGSWNMPGGLPGIPFPSPESMNYQAHRLYICGTWDGCVDPPFSMDETIPRSQLPTPTVTVPGGPTTAPPPTGDNSWCVDEYGPDCEGALDECDTLGPEGCNLVFDCLIDAFEGESAYFPFNCWPDSLGDPAVYLCRLFDCPGSPPSYCAYDDVAALGWCSAEGTFVDPRTTPTTAPTTAPPTSATPTSAPPPTVAGIQQTACDPAYSGACVPVAASDTINCDDVAGTGFRVVVIGVDPYGLDSDSDGVACEASAGTGSSGTGGGSTSGLALTGQSPLGPLLLSALLFIVGGSLLVSGRTSGQRLRGGFTVTRVDQFGNVAVNRVVSTTSKRNNG